MGSHQQFSLKWNSHQSNMLTVFKQMLSNEALVDVTLACEGLSLKAHKMVLSACSPYFQALFVENPCKHPIVILKDMRYIDLHAIVEYMYCGEVSVSQDQLSALLKTAETLKVKGLGEVTGEDKHDALKGEDGTDAKPVGTPRAESPPLKKRKRVRPRRRSLSGSSSSDAEDAPPAARIKRPGSPEVDGSVTAVPAESQTCSTAASSSTATESQSRTSSTAASSLAAVPSGAHIGSSAKAMNSMDASQHTRHYVGEDAVQGGDADFEVDPSSLVKQSMTIENEPEFTDVPSSQAPGNESKHLHHTGTTSDNSALVPVQASSPADISVSSQADVKPSFSSSSPVDATLPAATSSDDGACSGTVAMFVDKSGIPAVPGPSNHHPDERQQTDLDVLLRGSQDKPHELT